MLGVGLGLSQHQSPGFSLSVDFSTQEGGAAILPSWLEFTRASSGHTVQLGDNSIVVGGTIASNDVGCIGRINSAHSLGIRLAPERTNKYGYSRSANLASGTTGQSCVYTTGQTSPDGTTNAIRGQSPSGGYSRFHNITGVTGGHILSAWVSKGAGSGEYQVVAAYSGTTGAAVKGTAGSSWSRVIANAFPYPSNATAYVNPWDGRANATLGSLAGARDCNLDLIQFEEGREASDVIITSGGVSATRAIERLKIKQEDARRLVSGGRCSFYFKFRALSAAIGMDTTKEGWLFKSVGVTPSFSAQILGNSQQLVVSDGVNQSITATLQFSWVRGDLVEIWLEVGNGKTLAKWRINGGSITTAVFSGLDQSLNPLDKNITGIDLLSTANIGVMNCFLGKVVVTGLGYMQL